MKRGLFVTVLMMALSACSFSQEPGVKNNKFDKRLKELLDFSAPIITVGELWEIKDNVHILDAREIKEYETSHIRNAKYIGYDNREYDILSGIGKQDTVVLYCSVGYRSEKVAEDLIKKGFSNVFNLYGSIFEWVNQSYPVVDKNNKITNTVHSYNKRWSRWIDNPAIKKEW